MNIVDGLFRRKERVLEYTRSFLSFAASGSTESYLRNGFWEIS